MNRIVILMVLFYLLPLQRSFAQLAFSQENSMAEIQFDTARLAQYKADPEYQYQKRAPEVFWIQVLWQRIVDALKEVMRGSRSVWSNLLLTGLIAGAVVVMAYFLLHSRFQHFFTRRNIMRDQTRILNTTVDSDQLSGQIDQAIVLGDYRLALRWVYLDLLKKLGERKVLILHREKTNTDYRMEMQGHPTHQAFDFVADWFELFWYGGTSPDAGQFETFRDAVQSILAQNPGK